MILQKMKDLGFNPSSILDVGANKCQWAYSCRETFPDAKYFLIEPQREMIPYLYDFCRDKDVYFCAAAGRQNGECLLTIWKDRQGSSVLPQKDCVFEGGDKAEQRIVSLVSVNSLIQNKKIEAPQLAKLDVQGFEIDVLLGGSLLFDSCEAIILEVSFFEFLKRQPQFPEIISFMEQRNFVPYDIFNFQPRPIDGAVGQCDICFVKKTGPFRKSHRWNPI